ncbi:NUDIX hydrolase [Rhizobium giardinii]|nr:NUDIX hydrolase [Rhizobium giardinii]
MGTRPTFLSRLASNASSLFRKPPLEQYGALCYRRNKALGQIEVLLITSRDTLRWVIPKGWPMNGKKPHEVAAREAFEEAGVRGKAKKKPLGYFHYLKDGKVPCLVQVHAIEVDELIGKYPERGQRELDWVTCSEAAARVNEPELKGLFRLLEASLAGK